ncbi:superoxide dismutase family protein [Rubellimicrobium sp. CFH 75288]|uniref:superoxide dismutase family protein n=1 Tax=Rubellimicrobium sp. CFH 75288 TaxID=2697034 RepID=UPI001412A9F9|nr:superoxide dismutase family protein [Rubellimicrobium sp. CFH 75288]NAZ37476.1 superoxide dismutase family protein [Rubellimicrobium sp. CFH 75288]
MRRLLLASALPLVCALPLAAQDAGQPAAPSPDGGHDHAADPAAAASSDTIGGTGALVNAQGTPLGNVTLEAAPSGHSLVIIVAEGFPEGVFGVHLHEVGLCEGPGFESAGDHIAGEGQVHGIRNPGGPHAGDLPNAHVQADGVLAMEAFAIGLTAEMVFDEDGSALIVHESPDDYTTHDHGNSGGRIACAVVEASPAAEIPPEDAAPADAAGN